MKMKMLTFTSLALVACLAAVSPARVQQTKDIDVMVGKARVVTTDIAASNGVIHVIDHVLLPPGD
jgi:uncharacterized surface protein with fasciclin (FAS1) repeats